MKITILSFIIVLFICFIVILSVKKGLLETKYSILWFLTCFVLSFFSSNTIFINSFAKWIGVYYAPSLLFLLGLLFCLMIIFDLTIRISKLNNNFVSLVQDYAILKEKLKNIEKDKELKGEK